MKELFELRRKNKRGRRSGKELLSSSPLPPHGLLCTKAEDETGQKGISDACPSFAQKQGDKTRACFERTVGGEKDCDFVGFWPKLFRSLCHCSKRFNTLPCYLSLLRRREDVAKKRPEHRNISCLHGEAATRFVPVESFSYILPCGIWAYVGR